ncbi:hypothetical protein HaLaN_05200 [Haematococcus lacustris]|uniref:Uncharacterized protein n=1 Tax=Haematococcus lacustris TaxID=44745 RepID=A0A699YKY0_HAELA|nr:hypothetical protein HaLaN_05200 [Haematococcus lacustris]
MTGLHWMPDADHAKITMLCGGGLQRVHPGPHGWLRGGCGVAARPHSKLGHRVSRPLGKGKKGGERRVRESQQGRRGSKGCVGGSGGGVSCWLQQCGVREVQTNKTCSTRNNMLAYGYWLGPERGDLSGGCCGDSLQCDVAERVTRNGVQLRKMAYSGMLTGSRPGLSCHLAGCAGAETCGKCRPGVKKANPPANPITA